jgi:putative phage-type endonuclease
MKMNDRQQWLQDRKKGIGGSEISTVMGINSYETPYQLWMKKTGRVEPQEETAAMRFGSMAEKLVVDYWQQETGVSTILESDHLHDSEHPFIMGTPDRLYYFNNKNGVLECKTTKFDITPDDPKFHPFFCQLQWCMGLAKADVGEIAILNRVDCNFSRFEFEFNPDYYDLMRNQAIKIGRAHV